MYARQPRVPTTTVARARRNAAESPAPLPERPRLPLAPKSLSAVHALFDIQSASRTPPPRVLSTPLADERNARRDAALCLVVDAAWPPTRRSRRPAAPPVFKHGFAAGNVSSFTTQSTPDPWQHLTGLACDRARTPLHVDVDPRDAILSGAASITSRLLASSSTLPGENCDANCIASDFLHTPFEGTSTTGRGVLIGDALGLDKNRDTLTCVQRARYSHDTAANVLKERSPSKQVSPSLASRDTLRATSGLRPEAHPAHGEGGVHVAYGGCSRQPRTSTTPRDYVQEKLHLNPCAHARPTDVGAARDTAFLPGSQHIALPEHASRASQSRDVATLADNQLADRCEPAFTSHDTYQDATHGSQQHHARPTSSLAEECAADWYAIQKEQLLAQYSELSARIEEQEEELRARRAFLARELASGQLEVSGAYPELGTHNSVQRAEVLGDPGRSGYLDRSNRSHCREDGLASVRHSFHERDVDVNETASSFSQGRRFVQHTALGPYAIRAVQHEKALEVPRSSMNPVQMESNVNAVVTRPCYAASDCRRGGQNPRTPTLGSSLPQAGGMTPQNVSTDLNSCNPVEGITGGGNSENRKGNGSAGEVCSSKVTVECWQCHKKFMNPVTLQNHIRVVHDKAGEFKCNQCVKVFMWRSTLRNHVRLVHEKDRPHMCQICELRFRWKSHLEEHVSVVHDGEQPWKCGKCGKRFGRKNNCTKHTRRCTSVHPGVPGPS